MGDLAPFWRKWQKNHARLVFVYIDEAHAQDEWPIGNHLHPSLPNVAQQPKKTEDRVRVVHESLIPFLRESAPALLPDPSLLSESGKKEADPGAGRAEWVIDPPETSLFEQEYAPWPIRLYIVHDKKMAYIAEPKNGMYSLEELDARLSPLLL